MNNQALIKKVNVMPKPAASINITDEEFKSVLANGDLCVVEKHFHSHLETNQVLFVIKDGEIDQVYVKQITANGTRIYKES